MKVRAVSLITIFCVSDESERCNIECVRFVIFITVIKVRRVKLKARVSRKGDMGNVYIIYVVRQNERDHLMVYEYLK